MATRDPLPADGDPTEEPGAKERGPAPRDEPADAAGQRTEHPTPESYPSGGAAGGSS